jgi:hypothetical protein
VAIAPELKRPGDDAKTIELRIFDAQGQLVRPLIDPPASAAPVNRPPHDGTRWGPRPVPGPDELAPDGGSAPDEPDAPTPPTWRRPR